MKNLHLITSVKCIVPATNLGHDINNNPYFYNGICDYKIYCPICNKYYWQYFSYLPSLITCCKCDKVYNLAFQTIEYFTR